MLKKCCLVVGIILGSTVYASAGNVQTFGVGAKATAQAEAVAAHADDPFAVYYNPAGLTLSERPTLSTGFVLFDPVVELKGFKAIDENGNDLNAAAGNSSNAEINDDYLTIPHIGFSMPIGDKLAFGIAAYNPYGLHIKWDKDPAKNPGAMYAWESYYGRSVITPSVAYKVNDRLSVGFGVSLGQSISEAGKSYVRDPKTMAQMNAGAQAFDDLATDATANAATANTNMQASMVAYQTALQNGDQAAAATAAAAAYSYGVQAAAATQAATTFTTQATEARQGAALYNIINGSTMTLEAEDDFNYSFNAGVMYRPVDSVSMGLTYRGRTKTKFEGDVNVNGATNPVDGSKMNLSGSVDMEYDHPESIQAGVRYFASKKFSVEFDMTWTRWSILEKQVENVVLKGIPGIGNVPISFDHERDWEDTIQYKIGAEWGLMDNVALRGGYTYDPTPVPDHTYDLGWPDTDRSIFNVGCGWGITENWVLDSVVQYVVSTPTRKVRGESSELNHEYSLAFGAPVETQMDVKGELWGLGLTLSYLF